MNKSFEIKFAVDSMLYDYDRVVDEMGYGGAIKKVMKHHLMRGKFESIHTDLEEIGISEVKVNDKGFEFVRH